MLSSSSMSNSNSTKRTQSSTTDFTSRGQPSAKKLTLTTAPQGKASSRSAQYATIKKINHFFLLTNFVKESMGEFHSRWIHDFRQNLASTNFNNRLLAFSSPSTSASASSTVMNAGSLVLERKSLVWWLVDRVLDSMAVNCSIHKELAYRLTDPRLALCLIRHAQSTATRVMLKEYDMEYNIAVGCWTTNPFSHSDTIGRQGLEKAVEQIRRIHMLVQERYHQNLDVNHLSYHLLSTAAMTEATLINIFARWDNTVSLEDKD